MRPLREYKQSFTGWTPVTVNLATPSRVPLGHPQAPQRSTIGHAVGTWWLTLKPSLAVSLAPHLTVPCSEDFMPTRSALVFLDDTQFDADTGPHLRRQDAPVLKVQRGVQERVVR